MKQANNLTEMVFILDRSGSMRGMEADTVGGFNAMIEKQKAEAGEALVTTVLFDHEMIFLHDRIPLSEVQPLTENDYQVRGCTALFDAVGKTAAHIDSIRRYIRKEDIPAHTVMVITTDGMENASRKFSRAQIKNLIEAKKEAGWEVLFIGANIDAAAEAEKIGVSADSACEYTCDADGTGALFRSVAAAVSSVRKCGKAAPNWSAEIQADTERRK